MKRHFVASILVLFAVCNFAFCQEQSRAEIFAGYSLLHVDTQGVSGSSLESACNSIIQGLCPPGTFNIHSYFSGWNASAQFNVRRYFSVKGDFSGHYGTPLTLSSTAQSVISSLGITGFPPKAASYTFLGGPAAHQEIGRYSVFAHALFGGNRINSGTVTIPAVPPYTTAPISLSGSDTAFAMAFGGGVDFRVNQRIALRLGQGDYLYTKHGSNIPHQNNYRFSAGVVFSFGGRQSPASVHTREPEPPLRQPPAAPTHKIAGPSDFAALSTFGFTFRSRDSGGCEIVSVTRGSPASLAGLKPGDVINSINGESVRTLSDCKKAISGAQGNIHVGYLVDGYWQSEVQLVPLK